MATLFHCSRLPLTALLGFIALGSSAFAGDYTNSSSYNAPYGQQAGAENQTPDPSLRDANGNLTVVNGVFTSANFGPAAAGASANAFGASSASGVGTNGAGTAFGGSTAIGNQLNVVTLGNNNTVVVNATQNNSGNQTATTTINGH